MIRRRLPGSLALVWVLVIIISYFLVHQIIYKPLGEEVVAALGQIVLDIGAVLSLLVLSGALGTLFLRGLGDAFSALEQSVLAVLLGLGIFGLVVLIIGLLGIFPPTWLGWLAIVGLIAVLHRFAFVWLRSMWEAWQVVFQPDPTPFTRWMKCGLISLLMLAFLLALAPPTEWDAMTYHLAGPRLYLQAGHIISYPENHFLGFPQGIEMLYLWLMILARPQAAAILHWGFGVLMLMLVMAISQRAGRPSAGWIVAVVLLVSESLWGEFSWPYNDLALMAYTTAALAIVLIWDRQHDRRRDGLLVLAGIFVGLALGTKYTAASVAIGVGILILWLSRRDGFPRIVRAGGMVSIAALIVFVPWLIKNIVLDGNPFSPFVWGTPAFDRFDQWYYLRPGTGLNVLRLLIAPLEGTIKGSGGVAPYGASSGALVLALLPVAALGWRKRSDIERSTISYLLIFCLPPYLIWLAGLATSWYLIQTRLLFPIFPALALVAGLGLDGLRDVNLQPDIGRLLRPLVLIILTLALFNASLGFVRADTLGVTFGMQHEEDYLAQVLGVDYLAMQQVNNLPQDARILFLWEPRSFYCERTCIPDSLIDQWWHDRQVEPDPHKIIDRWREQGITHVLIADWAVDFMLREEVKFGSLSEADVVALDEVRESDMVLVWDFQQPVDRAEPFVVYSLYELRGTRP